MRRALDAVRSQGLSSRSATKLRDLGSWSEAQGGQGSSLGEEGEGKEHDVAERSREAIGCRRPGWRAGPGRGAGQREREERRKIEEKQDGVGASPQRWWRRTGQSQCWGLEMHQPQPARLQSQRVRGPDENGELECGGSSEEVRRMRRMGTKQGATEPPGQSRG